MERCLENLEEYLTKASIKNNDDGYHLDSKRIFSYISQIASGIRYLHEDAPSSHDKGLIYRDLKGSNILMKRNTQGELTIKLADFGMIYLPLFGTG